MKSVLSMTVALLVLSMVFRLLERRFAALPRRSIWRRERRTDFLPINEAITHALQLIQMFLLGFDPRIVAGAVPLLTFYAIFLHANVRWDFGPLRYVIASPRFHRWHHTAEEEGLDRNFAGLFPFIDLLFGNFYMPAGRQPRMFGVRQETIPAGFVAQLAYPFRRRASDPPAPLVPA